MQRPDPALPADYSSRVKSVRERLDLTQVQLAERIGVSFATVNRWENGQTKPARLAWRQILVLEAGLAPADSKPEAEAVSTAKPPLDFTARPAVVAAVARGDEALIRPPVQPRLRDRGLADRSAAAPADRGLRADARPVAAPVPARRRRRSRQDHHDRPLSARGAGPPARPARAGRAPGRPDRQLGTGDADAVLAAVPHRAGRGRAHTAIRSRDRRATG